MKTKRYLMNLVIKELLPQQEDLSRAMGAEVQQTEEEKKKLNN